MSSLAVAEPLARRPAPFTAFYRPWLILGAMWALCAMVMIAIFHTNIALFNFMDTDDALRLQQVRDLLAGQSWFDVTQYRINPPAGGPMHWSRIVDVPIGAMILLARPLIGQHGAEMMACIMVPLLLLGALCIALFVTMRRLAGDGLALFAVALLLLTPTILIQFPPMRIDHHGWQILMASVALAGAIDPRPLRGGMIAGLALAVWLQISTEGLPYAAMFGGLFILMQWIDERESPRLPSYACVLAGAGLMLLLATRGLRAPFASECDAFSAVYVWPLVLFALCLLAGQWLSSRNRLMRLMVPGTGALLAMGALLSISSPCLTAGPFHQLTPLAYQQWYMRVMEGRPIWEQIASLWGVCVLPALFGLGATLWAARSAQDGAARSRWLIVALLLLGAFVISLAVMRAMSVAHLFALPGTVWLIARLAARVQKLTSPVLRVPLTVALMMLTPVGLASVWAILAAPLEATPKLKTNCRTTAMLAPLQKLPPHSLLFAPLDIGPDILAHTSHSVVGTGHHRNVIGINTVTHAFLSPAEEARKDVIGVNAGRGADYVVLCPRMNEVLLYGETNPHGFAATLSQGRLPPWLEPVGDSGPLRIYRVKTQPGTKASATPFMQ